MTYDRIVLICMTDLNIKRLDVINQMTLTEFNYRMYALHFELLRKEHDMYKLAFAIRDAASTKNVGTEKKPKEVYRFKSVQDILDYEYNYYRLLQGKDIVFSGDQIEDDEQQNALLEVIADINKQISQ
ncbi:hypothetical protein EX199_01060 [Staphylococcus epidermidis]|jgi:hypothetical protein|nr:hypothetical protein HMPREF9994_02234 [Staphylococcus epidermidis NIHLM088]EJD88552.1 hypothetical protein HMPREF9992_02297 [Staphylococcus epidermidis NIHLM070]MBM0776081.1 hypothetical protein [Staphylococcus epidermidis]DAT89567.1 MAG TPA: hypothetical protein [Caudoviricetes sp.]NAM28793.1 hypothetical protein [Staphylococcus epidermidis]